MTSFKDFFKVLMADKFRNMNFILLINLIAIVVSAIWTLATGNFTNNTILQYVVTWSFFACFAAFVRLAVMHERIYTRDSYRLIPISDTNFYLTNLLTSFISFIYVGAVELILSGLSALINWQEYVDTFQMMTSMYGSKAVDVKQMIWGIVAMIIVMLAVTILAWTTISLIHLLSRAGSSFLPGNRSRIINFVVYIVVIWIVLRVVGFLMNFVQNSTDMFASSGDIWHFVLYVVGFLVVAAIEAAVNIYLMNRWVETVSES